MEWILDLFRSSISSSGSSPRSCRFLFLSLHFLRTSAMMGKEPVWNFPCNGCPLLWIDLCSRSRPSSPKLSDLWFYPHPNSSRVSFVWSWRAAVWKYLVLRSPSHLHLDFRNHSISSCYSTRASSSCRLRSMLQSLLEWYLARAFCFAPSSLANILLFLLIMCPNTSVFHFLVFWSSFDPVDVV